MIPAVDIAKLGERTRALRKGPQNTRPWVMLPMAEMSPARNWQWTVVTPSNYIRSSRKTKEIK